MSTLYPPTLHDGKGREGEAWLFFSAEFRRRLESVDSLCLSWNEASGWYFGRDVNGELADDRYLGQGLVPEAGRVAAFMTTVQLDPAGAGSRDRPFYRNGGPFQASLLEQLARYATGDTPYKTVFDNARNRIFEQRIATALAANAPGPAVDLPLSPGEFAALELALEWGGRHAASGRLTLRSPGVAESAIHAPVGASWATRRARSKLRAGAGTGGGPW